MDKRIIKILQSFLKEDKVVVKLEDNLMGDLKFTSLDMLEIVTVFEDEFQIDIPDYDITDFVVVRDLLGYVVKHEAV